MGLRNVGCFLCCLESTTDLWIRFTIIIPVASVPIILTLIWAQRKVRLPSASVRAGSDTFVA